MSFTVGTSAFGKDGPVRKKVIIKVYQMNSFPLGVHVICSALEQCQGTAEASLGLNLNLPLCAPRTSNVGLLGISFKFPT